MINTEISQKIEKAIKFLVFQMAKSGHNPKPVVLHSILVGVMLAELGYAEDVIIAGILHDVVEDSDTSRHDIQKVFGKKIALIVEAVSYNTAIDNPTSRYEEAIKRAIIFGKEALLVMAADFTQNIPYYRQGGELFDWLCQKVGYFMTQAKSVIGKELVFQKLQEQYKEYLS